MLDSYQGNANLAAILYLHRISDNRMAGSSMEPFQMFSRLSSSKAIPNLIIATTMWCDVKEETGARREQELKEGFWRDLLRAGCRTERFKDTHESAWHIVGRLADTARTRVQLPRIVCDCRTALKAAEAGNVSRPHCEDRIVL
jgi:hypothetical protein